MKKSYMPTITKRICLPVLLVIFSMFSGNAQIDITIGTSIGTNTATGYPAPLQDFYEGSKAQYLFLASELTAAGMSPGNISALKFNVTSLNGFTGTIEQMAVKIGATSVAVLNATNFETVNNTVLGPVDFVPVAGVNTLTFTSPFFWNGSSNIIVEICNGDPNNASSITYTENVSVALSTSTFNSTHTYRADNLGNLCGVTSGANTGTQTSRPQFIFRWTPASACSGPPNPGTISSTLTNACFGQQFTLSATGVTVASGLTYQWESSSASTGPWSPITGANALTFSTNQTATTYYRFTVACGTNVASTTGLLVSSPSLVQGVYTIDKNSPASATNFQSFNAAYNFLKCGISASVILNVVAGTGPYSEQLVMTAIPNTSFDKTVTFNGNGETIQFAGTAASRAVIKLDSVQHVIFDNLVIDATTGTHGYGVQLVRNSNYDTIRNCSIKSSLTSITTNFAGIVINGSDASSASTVATGRAVCDSNYFAFNKIDGGNYGIVLMASFNGGASGFNTFYGNTITNFYQYGLFAGGSYFTKIDSNYFARPTRTPLGDFNGIYFATEKNAACTITRNRITNPFGAVPGSGNNFYGIYFNGSAGSSGGGENVIANNAIYRINSSGPQYGIANASSDYAWYFHNTISLDSIANTSSSITRGFSMTGSTTGGLVMFNNNVSIIRGGLGTKHAVYLGGILPVGMDNNNFYVVTGTNNHVGFYQSNRTTIAQWRTSTGLDAASFSSNPAFKDIALEDYSSGNAALNNKGIYLGIDNDILNNVRDQATPDIGAWEATPPLCSTPPVTGTTTLSSTNVCQFSTVYLSLNIGAYGSAQTFQWETSTDNITFTPIGTPMFTADTTIIANTSFWYRVAVTCGSTTVYTNPVFLTVNPVLPQGTYTINAGSPATYVPGVAGGNFQTFNTAKAAMGCGIGGPIVFNVVAGSGPYNEQLRLDSILNSSAINTVTFNGNGNKIAFSSTNTNEKAVIKLSKAQHITFNNLNIDATGTGSNGVGVHFVSNADSNVIRNCTIITSTTSTSTSFAGIVLNGSDGTILSTTVSNCDGNLFENNAVTGGYYGIIAVSTTAGLINDNIFRGNTIQDFYSSGIYIGNGNTNTILDSNRVTRPTRTAGTSTIYGIYTTGTIAGVSLTKNRVYNLAGGAPTGTALITGIFSDATGSTANPILVINNLLYNFTGLGVMTGIGNSSSSNINYYHNTIALDNGASNGSNTARGFNLAGTATGLQFKNNIVTVIRAGTGLKHAIYIATGNTIEADNNNYFVTVASTNYIGYDGTNRRLLSDWQTPTRDANGLSINPGYSDPVNGNYTPVVAPLDNKGVSLGIPTDIKGAVRSTTTPDIGAFEFTVPPCAGPFATVATVTPNTGICVDVPIVLDIPGSLSSTGLKFVWQNASSAAGPWTDISDSLDFPQFDTLSLPSSFYRALIVCNGNVINSTVVSINMNALLVGGTYTINSAVPTNYTGTPGANFNSFAAAVAVMSCGITGNIIFNVAQGTNSGTYTEQVKIGKVPGTSLYSVTFQSDNGIAASRILTFSATSSTSNFTLKLDSSINFIFKNLTIEATSTTNGRAVEFAGTASRDSLLNCIIKSPVTTSTSNTLAAVFGTNLSGKDLVIKGNTISNGSSGINLSGPAVTNLSYNHIIDSNIVTGGYAYSIYANQLGRVRLTNNTMNVSSPITGTFYGLYATNCDSAYRIIGNTVNINNVTGGSTYGIYVLNSDASVLDSGIVASNRVIAGAGNTGNIYGLTNYTSNGNFTVNNTMAINSAGTISYGLYSFNSNNINYFNNSVNMSLPIVSPTATSYAAYFNHAITSSALKINNNIFSHKGGGKALYVNNPTLFTADYNMLYTSGTNLVQTQTPAANYTNVKAWVNATYWDANSIVYPPAFISDTDLRPDLNNPDVWAIHGRGTHVANNTYDFNNVARPITTAAGVPDLGAYEFFPVAQPTVLVGTPAVPVANSVQTFMYGSDTVMKVKWGGIVPPDAVVKRYSGAAPQNLVAGTPFMYFYTKLESSAGGNFPLELEQFYIDPWQGTIPDQNGLGLGKTTPGNAWIVGFGSKVDVAKKKISEGGLTYFDKFTGFVNPYAPPILPDQDSSNRGKRFWVGYQKSWHFDNGSNTQDMILYLSTTDQAANVQVKINGKNWVRNYVIPANTTRASDLIPKAGADDARLLDEGKYTTGISIVSDVPITAYAHIYASTNSGASMLFPVGVWGYEYYSLNNRNNYSSTGAYNTIMVISDNDNTVVEITPTNPTLGGKPANVPFTVTLNKGEVYQVLGAMIGGSDGYDITGSKIKSIPNSTGKCFPIAAFSGSSRTGLGCGTSAGGSGDLLLNQIFPYSAWGKEYLTSPTSTSGSINSFMTNIYRIMVKDPTTTVTVTTTGGANKPTGPLINGRYYQYESNGADRIVANKPIMVGQYMSSSGSCPNTGGDGDPDQFILSPLEQAISGFSGFYRNNLSAINTNYLMVVLPTNGMNSLKIDNVDWAAIPAASKWTYAHTKPGYSVAIRRWPAGAGQSSVYSDSSYTGQVYGLGSVESYGYNVGTLVKSINEIEEIGVDSATNGNNKFTCVGAPFKLTVKIPLIPNFLTIKFGSVPGLTPGRDTTLLNPVPSDSTVIRGITYYSFKINQSYVFSNPGVFPVSLQYASPDVESCDNTKVGVIFIQVLPAPKADFQINFAGCVGNTAQFTADTLTENGIRISKWNYTFHDASTSTIYNPTYTYNTAGNYTVKLNYLTPDGCIGDTIKTVTVRSRLGVAVLDTTITVCYNTDTTFKVENPDPGATYNWYTTASGGTPIATGPNFTITGVTSPATYFVGGINVPCIDTARTQVFVVVLPQLPPPVVTVGIITSNSIEFNWAAVTGATGYQISTDTGQTWIPVAGLSYTATGLLPTQSVCIIVRALGVTSCENSIPSTEICATVGCPTVTVQVIQSSFTVCPGTSVTMEVLSPVAGYSYTWYDGATGATVLGTGTIYSTTVNNADSFYVGGQAGGCSTTKAIVRTNVIAQLSAPVPVVDSVGTTFVAFSWPSIAGATGYQVSINGGSPVSPNGANGISHIVTGLTPLDTIRLVVTVLGDSACQTNASGPVTGITICTSFSPQVVTNSISNCANGTVTFNVQNPGTGTYNWYNTLPPVTSLASGTSFTTPPITSTTDYWVVATVGGCVSNPTKVTAVLLSQLPAPVITVTGTTSSSVTFSWGTVAGAVSYLVTLPSGSTVPLTATTYTVTGLTPLQNVTISVTAIGNNTCQNSISNQTGQASCLSGTILAAPIDTTVCIGQSVTFRVINPVATTVYRWFDVATGGVALSTGTTYNVVVASTKEYWVEAEFAPGCIGATRFKVKVNAVPVLGTPIVRLIDSTASSLTFSWNSVAGAVSYQLSINGTTVVTTTSTTYTVANLTQLQTVSIVVKAIGAIPCQTSLGGTKTGTTLNNQVFIPNTFLPNSANNVNTTLRVFSNVLKDGRLMIFNQWGEKVYESNNVADLRNKGWDGTFKGKNQPVGVYMYVAKFTLTDGAVIEKKGSINLIR